MSFLLTREVADDAFAMVSSAVARSIEAGQFGDRNHLHVVIGNPIPPSMEIDQARWESECILFEGSIGDRALWKMDYQAIARSKCYLTWRWQKPTREIPAHVLQYGDTIYYGSAILEGIPVAASGFQPFDDEMISMWVAAACRAKCLVKAVRLRELFPSGFITA